MADADAIARALAAAGTRACFGVPGGGGNLDLVGACARHGIRFVLTHGETAAVIAAAVHGELAGAPGLALCTRGPGLAAAVNGIAQATLDRQAVVVVTDGAGHRFSHQRIDHAALVAPVAKAVCADPERAVALACAGPPGAVVIDAGGPARLEPPAPPPARHDPPPRLPAARRPVVVAGVGALDAPDAVRRLVRGTQVPVLETYRAKGVVPGSWPNVAGLLTGGTLEAPVLEDADLVLAVGLDPVELIPASWPYAAPVVAVAPWAIDDPYLPLAASAVGPLDRLLAALVLDGSGWARAGRAYRAEAEARLRTPAAGFGPHAVVDAIAAAPGATARATVDAGAHMLVAMPFLPAEEPRRCLISSGLATMGFALPAAIGASLADPQTPVVCVTGDGGLGMCLAELETLARIGTDVRVVVLDDATLSLIAIKQGPGQGGSEAVRYGPHDLAAAARAAGLRATTAGDAAGLAAALAAPGPSLVAARIDPAAYGGVLEATRGARR